MLEFDKIIFNDFEVIIRTVLVGIMAYLSLVVILRVSGKRTLTKMNAFDFIVTIALGSILASIITSKDITIAQGLTAFLVLVIMQYIFTKLSVKSRAFSSMIKSQPALLYYNEEFLTQNMKKERVLEIEVRQAARSSGKDDMSEVMAVVLETDGSISVISNQSDEPSLDRLFKEVKK
ncbi:membrane protein [Salinicoccus roseus]|uniref:Membrane protein n=1 Tax=Salinicoccus roseus TaxID=45670 RepID=A0A0C2H8I8_9STAP|nr:membrane protein [Salinicoccus roseus]